MCHIRTYRPPECTTAVACFSCTFFFLNLVCLTKNITAFSWIFLVTFSWICFPASSVRSNFFLFTFKRFTFSPSLFSWRNKKGSVIRSRPFCDEPALRCVLSSAYSCNFVKNSGNFLNVARVDSRRRFRGRGTPSPREDHASSGGTSPVRPRRERRGCSTLASCWRRSLSAPRKENARPRH